MYDAYPLIAYSGLHPSSLADISPLDGQPDGELIGFQILGLKLFGFKKKKGNTHT